MEVLFGITGDGFTLVAADCSSVRSILAFKHDEDKIVKLDKTKMLAASGEHADRTAFTDYVVRNMVLDEYRTGIPKTCNATAHYIRGELATALRRRPYNVNILLAGVDIKTEAEKAVDAKRAARDASASSSASSAASAAADDAAAAATATSGSDVTPHLYYMDYLGTMHEVKYAAHGYAAYFCLSVMDRYWKPKMTQDEALHLLGLCIAELRVRFLVSLPHFTVRIVDKDGIKDVDFPVITLPVLPPPSEMIAVAGPRAAAAVPVAVAAAGGGAAGRP